MAPEHASALPPEQTARLAPEDASRRSGRSAAALQAAVAPGWRSTGAPHTATLLGLAIAAVGILASRVDLVIIALPLLVSVAIAIDRRPPVKARGMLRVDVARRRGSRSTDEFGYRVVLDPPTGTELVHLRLTPQGSRPREIVLAPRPYKPVTGSVPLLHSGLHRVVAISFRLIGIDGGWIRRPAPEEVAERTVAPAIVPIASIPLPHRLTGMTGTHGSARTGEGGDFRDVHPYSYGDRLRRIDWKATARRSQGLGELYVRRTFATSDATLILVIDSRDDVGEWVEDWWRGSGEAGLSSMDLAREAAASLAAAAIGAGDRVGLHDVAAPDRVVAPDGGKRHLDRLLRRIEITEPSGVRFDRRRRPIVPAGSIVYLLSTFLDDEAASVALLWRAVGHRVICVDVLPTARLDGREHGMRIAHRLVMTQRGRRLADLRASGIEVFRWQQDPEQPSRAASLRSLARAGRGSR